MSVAKRFIIFVAFIVVVSTSPTNFHDVDHTINRLSDIGMHPHITHNSHNDHKKVKRSVNSKVNEDELDNNYWIKQAKDLVTEKIKNKFNVNKAKNVILFLGDGMSHSSLAAARVLQGDESSKLSFEHFPYTASSKTYCVDKSVADSACSATAFLHGVKNNVGTIGMNAQTSRGNCHDTNNENLYTSSIASWFLNQDKNAGLVTTTRITDATPASVYANSAEREWEGNENVTASGCDHTDIYDLAEQLVRGSVGSKLKVALGGGSTYFVKTTETQHGEKGKRSDGKNLIDEWISSDTKRHFVKNRKELIDLDVKNMSQVLGLFAANHIPYHLQTAKKNEHEIYPTLTEMTIKAIDILSNDDKGYFLLVEGGRIDHGHHENQARFAIQEVLEFSKAIQAVLNKVDLDETLVVVTADHSHVMSVAGYSPRGSDIFGASNKADDGMPYFTISYANGPGFNTHFVNGNRVDLQKVDTKSIDFRFPATAPRSVDTHAGEDVGIWAIGPSAHLFKGTLEQNVIAHIMAYASCVGDGLKICD